MAEREAVTKRYYCSVKLVYVHLALSTSLISPHEESEDEPDTLSVRNNYQTGAYDPLVGSRHAVFVVLLLGLCNVISHCKRFCFFETSGSRPTCATMSSRMRRRFICLEHEIGEKTSLKAWLCEIPRTCAAAVLSKKTAVRWDNILSNFVLNISKTVRIGDSSWWKKQTNPGSCWGRFLTMTTESHESWAKMLKIVALDGRLLRSRPPTLYSIPQ